MKKKNKKKSKVNSNIKQTIVIFIITVALFYLMTTLYSVIKKPANIFLLQKGTIYLEDETEGLIIREEQVVKGENYKNGMLQIKTEGERVAKGDAIFRYYSESENSLKQKIAEIETEIQARMPESQNSTLSDIALIENQINVKLGEINSIYNLQKIKESKTDILTNITKKLLIIADNSNNSIIHDLLVEKQNYENELAKNSEYVNAPTSGVVSYRVDNLEEELKTGDFSYLNKEKIHNISAKVGQIVATSEDSGKVINNFESYIAVVLDSNEAKVARIGDKVKLEFSNSEKIDAEIAYINVETDDSRTIVFKVTRDTEELINYRKISLSIIWTEFNGFKVPNSAILVDNNKNYLVRNRNGNKDNILIKIEEQNNKSSIVNSYTNEELEDLGFTKKEINKIPKLKLYDEILMDATN